MRFSIKTSVSLSLSLSLSIAQSLQVEGVYSHERRKTLGIGSLRSVAVGARRPTSPTTTTQRDYHLSRSVHTRRPPSLHALRPLLGVFSPEDPTCSRSWISRGRWKPRLRQFYAATIRIYTRHCVYYVSRMKPAAICPDDRPDIASECDVLDAASLLWRAKNQKRKFARMDGKMIDTRLYHASRHSLGRTLCIFYSIIYLITFKHDI